MSQATIKIPSELFALAESSRFEGTLDVGTLPVGPDDYAFEGPVSWWVDVTNTGSAFLVAGKASGTAVVACSRCLEDVEYDLQGDIEGYFLTGAEAHEDFDDDDDAPGADEFDVLPEDHVIDLTPLIRAALMVDAVGVPLCRDDCAGLCPVCGANLNEGDCGCGGDAQLEEFNRAANPFAALADYKFNE